MKATELILNVSFSRRYVYRVSEPLEADLRKPTSPSAELAIICDVFRYFSDFYLPAIVSEYTLCCITPSSGGL